MVIYVMCAIGIICAMWLIYNSLLTTHLQKKYPNNPHALLQHLCENKPGREEGWELLASKYQDDEMYAEAIKAYDSALICNPSSITYKSNRARCYFEIGETKKAIEELEKCIGKGKRSEKEAVFIELTNILITIKEFSSARVRCYQGLEQNSQCHQLKLHLAKAFLGENKHNDAHKIIDEYLRINNQDEEAREISCICHSLKGNHIKAIQIFENWVKNIRHTKTFASTAKSYLAIQDWKKAVLYFSQDMSLHPENIDSKIGITEALIGEGSIEEAKEMIPSLMDFKDNPKVQEILKRIS